MNGVLGHDSALQDYTGPETTRANKMNLIKEKRELRPFSVTPTQ